MKRLYDAANCLPITLGVGGGHSWRQINFSLEVIRHDLEHNGCVPLLGSVLRLPRIPCGVHAAIIHFVKILRAGSYFCSLHIDRWVLVCPAVLRQG